MVGSVFVRLNGGALADFVHQVCGVRRVGRYHHIPARVLVVAWLKCPVVSYFILYQYFFSIWYHGHYLPIREAMQGGFGGGTVSMRPGIDAGECYVREVAAYLLVRVQLANRSWVWGC